MCITLHIKKKKVSDLTVKELEDFIELVVQRAMFKHFSSDMPIGVMGNQGYFIEPKQNPLMALLYVIKTQTYNLFKTLDKNKIV